MRGLGGLWGKLSTLAGALPFLMGVRTCIEATIERLQGSLCRPESHRTIDLLPRQPDLCQLAQYDVA
jgi:hypothetical protein